MLPAFRRSAITFRTYTKLYTPALVSFSSVIMPVAHPRSASRSPSPSAKRVKLSAQASTSATAESSTRIVQDAAPIDEAAEVERLMSLPLEFEKQYEKEIQYGEKLVLAPMVRTGSCKSPLMYRGNRY